MKEILKKDLIQQIQESKDIEMDEMGTYKQRFQGTRKEKGTGDRVFDPKLGKMRDVKPSRYKELYHPEIGEKFFDKTKNREADAPYGWVLNPQEEKGKGVVVIGLKDETEEQLLKNPKFTEWFESIVQPMIGTDPDIHTVDPTVKIHFVDWIKMGHKLRFPKSINKISPKVNDALKRQTGVDVLSGLKTKDVKPREAFLRDLYPEIRKKLDGLNNTLYMMGFPPIAFPTQEEGEQKKHSDIHSEKENENVTLATHSVYGFDEFKYFAQNADEILDLHALPEDSRKDIAIAKGENMARRYNAGTNWAFERKQLQTDANFKKNPLTKVYKLEKQGKKAQEKDYIIVTHFQLTGKHENGQYEWFVDVITEISEKLREESGGQLLPVVSFNAGASVPVPNGLKYDEKDSILDNHPSIKRALESCLDDVRNKLLQYDPIEQLEERIFKTRGQVTKKSMNESEITDLVKRIVRESMK